MLQCSISECKQKAVETVKISFRETKEHYKLFKNKDRKHIANFSKASKF
jgi:hypothetical protein